MAILRGVPAIAKYLCISEKTVREWQKKDELNFPVKNVSGVWYTSSWLVDQWIAQGKCLYKIRPNPEDIVDVIAMAGMKEHFEVDPDHGGYRLKEGSTLTIDNILKAVSLKVTISDKKPKDAGQDDIWEIFPDDEEQKQIGALGEKVFDPVTDEAIKDETADPIPKESWEG